MKDIILISKGYKIENLNENLEGPKDGKFSIHYIRFKNQSDVKHIIQKDNLDKVSQNKIINKGEIKRKPDQFGSLAIDTVEEAIQTVKSSLENPNSNVRKADFSKDTVIIITELGLS